MKLNHLSLVVTDVPQTAAFFEQFFGFNLVENKGDVIAILKSADSFTLVLTRSKDGDAAYPEDFHFGFFLDNQDEVLHAYEQLRAAGHHVPRAPAKIRQSFGFYFTIPGGIRAEVASNC
ncbi:MAG: VOC family protein [Pedobacter sp.]|nr:MAG: VOC family protein [Pedobacter sp.]